MSASSPDRPVHSVTALMTYERCPHQYYVTFVRHIPPPITAAMQRGTNIHKLIADHLTQPSLFPPDMPDEVRPLWETFLSSRFNRAPVAREEPFLLEMDGGAVKGRIDAVLPRDDGGLEIVDFKSGVSAGKESVVNGLQLPLYTLATARRFAVPPESLRYTYFFLTDGKEVSVAPDVTAFGAVRDRVEGIMRGIAERQFTATPGCTCHACTWTRERGENRRAQR